MRKRLCCSRALFVHMLWGSSPCLRCAPARTDTHLGATEAGKNIAIFTTDCVTSQDKRRVAHPWQATATINATVPCRRHGTSTHARFAGTAKIEPQGCLEKKAVPARARKRRYKEDGLCASSRGVCMRPHLHRRAGRRACGGGRQSRPHPRERSERSHPSTPMCNASSFALSNV